MRLLILSELFYPHGGGAELATKLYADMLALNGFKVTVVTKRFASEEPSVSLKSGIEIYRLSMNSLSGTRYETLANVGKLANCFIHRLIKQSDIIYVPCGWYSIIPIAKLYKKPVVVHLHNYSLVCSTSLMYDFSKQKIAPSSLRSYVFHERLERNRDSIQIAASSFMSETLGKHYSQLGRLADALFFVSKSQMNLALQELPQLKNKSHFIYNPLPDVPFIKTKEKAVGYFGGKRFVKGFPVLMSSLRLLKGKPTKVYMTMTSDTLQTIQISKDVTLNLLPKISNPDLLRILKNLSVVVVPSMWPEPLPYTLLESMLYGKLVVASNIGGISEVVHTGTTLSGVALTKPGDYEDIADKLDSFLALTLDEVNELGSRNREHILQKFDNKKAVCSFIKVLDQL